MAKMFYLDNSSTTFVCESAKKNINFILDNVGGNPSSLHILGMQAEEKISDTRKAVSRMLKCRDDEIFFTGSGTEANNTALFGAVSKNKKRGKRIVTTSIEHPSVLRVCERLEGEGFEVVYLKPKDDGVIDTNDLKNAINKDTILVSIMLVNNETGAVQPVADAKKYITAVGSPALLHTDAVQAFGKMPLNVEKLGVDLLSASAHKIHGPKGVGILYKRQKTVIPAYILGGGQESGMRSGTESVPLIYGLCGAIEELPDIEKQFKTTNELKSYTENLLTKFDFIRINSSRQSLPYILNISVLGLKSETLLHYLERKNIYVSSGSACAKGVGSYVLKECGLSKERIDSALRISFSRYNTYEDIDALADAIGKAHNELRGTK